MKSDSLNYLVVIVGGIGFIVQMIREFTGTSASKLIRWLVIFTFLLIIFSGFCSIRASEHERNEVSRKDSADKAQLTAKIDSINYALKEMGYFWDSMNKNIAPIHAQFNMRNTKINGGNNQFGNGNNQDNH